MLQKPPLDVQPFQVQRVAYTKRLMTIIRSQLFKEMGGMKKDRYTNYRFSFCKLQIFIWQITEFHFISYWFPIYSEHNNYQSTPQATQPSHSKNDIQSHTSVSVLVPSSVNFDLPKLIFGAFWWFWTFFISSVLYNIWQPNELKKEWSLLVDTWPRRGIKIGKNRGSPSGDCITSSISGGL